MKCVMCDEELRIHEQPQRGLPPVCDRCARATQSWPVKKTGAVQTTTEEVSV